MTSPSVNRCGQQGQAIVLFVLALSAIVLGVAVVIDGGYAYAQRRASQNAADFAALAGTRVVGVSLIDQPPGAGTALDVENAIDSVLTANGAQLVQARYVDDGGAALGNVVGATSIPRAAQGVVVEARVDWEPFLLGTLGVSDWAASASATAMTAGRSDVGGVLPVGIHQDTFDALASCEANDLIDCVGNFTSSELNIPGGFGWLAFGVDDDKCNWDSLGMDEGGCEVNQGFLDYQIGPPSHSFGCCDEIGNSVDFVANLTGNEWGDLSAYVEGEIPVWVPIWDAAYDGGRNAYYHIVGFGVIIFTGDNEHARWLEGVAIRDACDEGQDIEDHLYCTAPGGDFVLDATGEVRLLR